MTIAFDWTGPPDGAPVLLLAHGAGVDKNSPLMTTVATLLADRGIRVARFDFAYMTERRRTGSRRPPPKAESLAGEMLAAIRAARAACPSRTFAIGGKSMGGRVASMLAGDLHAAGTVDGLVCLGYPFHPPGTPDRLRIDHLRSLTCPTLIVQGERDPFGNRGEVESFSLAASIRVHWSIDGDHDLGPRGGSGTTRKANLGSAADAVADFLEGLSRR